ncbi:hypothetical protein KIH74_24045 [Kineosporia sp. J2-2]|uniref:Core-2/I-Branching enzyme n=1 Tax=Kineosporia corallincola TaxID=2835133 RepID=A0ABS5TLR4_9ACTN|nr:beta-1,6-N-acetylglucosaminyltransferase [Kineosporia corallincola]MBT0772036.1 hypothetical protein [Kineosporia corallincola]
MHAFLLLVHTDPALCGLLTGRLAVTGPVFVHVDARADEDPFRKACPQAVFVQNRVRVRWGGWGQTEATLRLIETALTEPEVRRVSLLSGQHYPIVPDARLTPGPLTDRIAALPAPDPARGKPESRFTERFLAAGRPGSASAVLAAGIGRRLPALDPAQALGGRRLFAGSPYFSLTRSTAAQVVAAARTDAALRRYFRAVVSSDEAFFHTVVGNLDGVHLDTRGTTYATWSGGRHPQPLTPGDLEPAAAEGFLYARKFSSADQALLHAAQALAE